jgi:hypothetical protein
MHRRAIPNACWVLRLHVFDLYSERSQFAAYNGTPVAVYELKGTRRICKNIDLCVSNI